MKEKNRMILLLCSLGVLVLLCLTGAAVSKGRAETVQKDTKYVVAKKIESTPLDMTGGIIEEEKDTTEEPQDLPSVGQMEEETVGDGTQAEDGEENAEEVQFAIADVDDYVNVRSLPSTDGQIVGRMYDGAVAQVQSAAGDASDWFQIISGNVEGYIKAEYFISGDEAAAIVDDYVTTYALIRADRLNVRSGPSTEEARIGYLLQDEKVVLLENQGEWLKIAYSSEKEGYIAAEYAVVSEEYTYAKTMEEVWAEEAAKKELEDRNKTKEEDTPQILGNVSFPATSYTSNEELRKGIVDYALQYVGYPYIHGGSSLAKGTDCSGFTCFIYADFGYSISRTPQGQYTGAGKSIDYSAIQPGDIICYSSNGGASCTHVAIYIGDGQIVHAANSKKGVIIGKADYSPIIGIRNVID